MTIVEHIDRLTRLALKAQAQCRATIETLTLIKNPTTVFASQANIAHGPQQVNNTRVGRLSREDGPETDPITLLEGPRERMDCGTTRAAGADSSAALQ